MTEYETDPQRSPAPADAEPSQPTAELPPAERGQSDSTTPAAAPVPADSPAAGATAAPEPTAATEGARPETPAPASPYAPPTATPSAPPYPVSGQPQHPVSGQPQPGAPWYGGQQQTGWAAGAPYQGGPGYPPHAAGPMPPYQGQQPYQPHHAGQPHHPGQPVPPWGPAPVARPSRAGKFVGAGALVLALMFGSGVAGGALALALDGDSGGVTRTYSAAPVLNSADLPKIAAAVQDSVVSIITDNGEGSGVILSADGFVLTNNHVVASATGDTVRVVFADGKTVQAKIVGTDPKTDLAVVKASGVSGLKAAKFGDSDGMQVGDQVLALGSPLGLQGSVTAGILSARDRTIQAGEGGQQQNSQQGASSISGLLQTDAPINPGNSGGALVNTRGEVIGINTAIATAGQGSNGNIGVGFAIPSNKAKDVAQKLQRGEKVSHPSLGVSVNAAEDGGALVAAVSPGSAAEKAGLQRGDVITKFGDKVINDSNDLVGAVQSGKVGDRVEVQFKRNGSAQTATVTLAETS
ncbi:trypsin-like peptidase domain-containing protein [Micromonospora sp. NBC_00898]|uniref:trypsin-like peptidase domain-containing protein n=1 Tax=Micromonospora sp. NBC_00898 TaxID=2975981 RepID=UPI003864B2C7|nr:trypsin-like peptidase domain-containing protein [Micromonospora sp. NBC_00898]